jgi:tetratricopeptide (TPR) repeat protein
MQRSFWVFGTILALIFLIAMSLSPGHFGFVKFVAGNHFDMAVKYDAKGEIDTAIGYYDKAIQANPELVDAYNNRGIDRRKRGNFEGAIADFSEVIRLRPEEARGYYNRATTYRISGKPQEAIADYDPAIRHAGGRAEEILVNARLGRGRLLLDQNLLDDAAVDFNAVLIEGGGARTDAAINLIRIELLKGNFEAAVSMIDTYAIEGPSTAAAGFFLGFVALFRDNDPHRAAAIFQEALTKSFKLRDFRAMMGSQSIDDGLPFTPSIHQMIVWQHLARQRAGDDDRSELQDYLRQLGAALKGADSLTGVVSSQNMIASRVEWPGPVVDLFLGLKTPESLAALATAAADPLTRRHLQCDVDFYSGLLALTTKPPEARALIQRAAENCPPSALEGVAAKLELGRI